MLAASMAPATLAGIIRAGQARAVERAANLLAAQERCRAARAGQIATVRQECHAATVDRAAGGNVDSALYLLTCEPPTGRATLDLADDEIDGIIGTIDAIEAGADVEAMLASMARGV